MRVVPVFGKSPAGLGKKWHLTSNGDSVRVDVFKFFLGAFCLDGSNLFCEAESCHLIDFDGKDTAEFRIPNLKEGLYEKLSFAIGVDSLKNTAGALEGDLDPASGMFWAWNTGYIAAKIEGISPSCKTKDRAFEFHIGGYRSPYNSCRKSSISISPFKIEGSNRSELVLMADLSAWFGDISLAKMNHVVEPGKNAMKIADNYTKMISVQKGELK